MENTQNEKSKISPKKPTSFMVAMKHFFGFKPGQKLGEFSDEVKQAGNREFLIEGLRQNGYEITSPEG